MNETNAPVSTRGVLSLVFALLALTGACPCVGSIAAILLGMGDRNPVGRAGFHLGWISLVLATMFLFVAALFLGGAALIEAMN